MKHLIVVAFAVLIAFPAFADFAEGVKEYRRGNYSAALKEFSPLAEQGNPSAQCALAIMYQDGVGVMQDHDKAKELYFAAAAQGFTMAECNLGVMYFEGKGVAQDYIEATKWFLKAAEYGDILAQSYLALVYSKGLGIKTDFREGYMWFKIVALNAAGLEIGMNAAESCDFLSSFLTPSQMALAEARARSFCRRYRLKTRLSK